MAQNLDFRAAFGCGLGRFKKPLFHGGEGLLKQGLER
jgi:hypothetical protein